MKVVRSASSAVVLASLAVVPSAPAQVPGAGAEAVAPVLEVAAEPLFFGGLRLYINQYDLPFAQRIFTLDSHGVPVTQDTISNTTSKTTVAPVVFAGVRHKRFVASASYTPTTQYRTNDPLLGAVKREDLDFSLGYLVVPTVAVAVAYKRVTQDKTTGQIDPATGVTQPAGSRRKVLESALAPACHCREGSPCMGTLHSVSVKLDSRHRRGRPVRCGFELQEWRDRPFLCAR